MDTLSPPPVHPWGETPPEGTMVNRYGHLVPTHMIKPQHRLEDQTVRALVAKARELQARIAAFKAQAFADVRAYLSLLDEQYGLKRSGVRGGIQLESFDGTMRVQISIADSIALGPEISSAKALIDECVRRWTEGANSNLKALVDDAFAVREGGKLAVDRILALRRLEIDDDTWRRAMQAIDDAVKVTRSREYLRLYVRPAPDRELEQLALDFSRL